MEGQSLYTVIQSSFMLMLLATAFGADHRIEQQSCGDKGVFLTLNNTLAPLDMISASGTNTVYTRADLYNFGHERNRYFRSWCTTDFNPDPYVEIELTSSVLITLILTNGRSTPNHTFFVTNFTLEYSLPNDPANLSYYLTETGDIQYFTSSEFNLLIQFEEPLLTKRLRVRPKTWFDSDPKNFEFICLGIALYGCLATEGTPLVSDMDLDDQQALTQAIITTSSFNDNGGPAAEVMSVVVKDNQVVAIVLPVALLTIIINATIVGVGVFVCIVLRRQNKEKNEKNRPHSYVNIGMLTKSLEPRQISLENDSINLERVNMPRSSDSVSSVAVIKKVDNPIYGTSFTTEVAHGNATADELIYTLASEPGYEHINSSKGANNDLLDNQGYGEVRMHPDIPEHSSDLDPKDNVCYDSVPSTPIPDEGEYSYPTDNYKNVRQNDYVHS